MNANTEPAQTDWEHNSHKLFCLWRDQGAEPRTYSQEPPLLTLSQLFSLFWPYAAYEVGDDECATFYTICDESSDHTSIYPHCTAKRLYSSTPGVPSSDNDLLDWDVVIGVPVAYGLHELFCRAVNHLVFIWYVERIRLSADLNIGHDDLFSPYQNEASHSSFSASIGDSGLNIHRPVHLNGSLFQGLDCHIMMGYPVFVGHRTLLQGLAQGHRLHAHFVVIVPVPKRIADPCSCVGIVDAVVRLIDGVRLT